MFTCPSCSADMHFDPASQMLKCAYCDKVISPHDYKTLYEMNAVPVPDYRRDLDTEGARPIDEIDGVPTPAQAAARAAATDPDAAPRPKPAPASTVPAGTAATAAAAAAAPVDTKKRGSGLYVPSIPKPPKAFEDFDATLFTCPQCGAELISTDATAATFCSFCGSSVLLSQRVCKQKTPD
ncbi:MAG: hypothetical protein IJJ14_06930 [Coriobacteriales bacterium]|nr:hypothetical protein [Coriobacteriales bacterium]